MPEDLRIAADITLQRGWAAEAKARQGDREAMVELLRNRVSGGTPEQLLPHLRVRVLRALDEVPCEAYSIEFHFLHTIAAVQKTLYHLLLPETWREIEQWMHELQHQHFPRSPCPLCHPLEVQRD